jgi:protein-S-isoprenylcysteine O-methyltransferase Ste14
MSASFAKKGGWWVVGQGLLMTANLALGWFWSDTGADIWHWLALALWAVATFFGLGGFLALGKHLTPFPQPKPGFQLVRHGVYAWVRHPLYTAVTTAAGGWAAWRVSPGAAAAALALGIFFRLKAAHEEKWLESACPEYADYRRHTRWFIPFLY